jgi:hypothetical protein
MNCPRCSKSIRPGAGKRLPTGETVHVRCLARNSQTEAQAVRKDAADVAQPSRSLTNQATRLRACAVCGRRLNTGGGLLFQGDRLVHALCWDSGQGPSADKDFNPKLT